MLLNTILPLLAGLSTVVLAIPAPVTPSTGLWASSTVHIARSPTTGKFAKRAEFSGVNKDAVQADCQWRWLRSYQVDQLHCTVKDKKCDAHEVYAELELYIMSTVATKKCGRIKNASGCHADPVRDGVARVCTNSDFNYAKARVRACVDKASDECFGGNWVDNPLT